MTKHQTLGREPQKRSKSLLKQAATVPPGIRENPNGKFPRHEKEPLGKSSSALQIPISAVLWLVKEDFCGANPI